MEYSCCSITEQSLLFDNFDRVSVVENTLFSCNNVSVCEENDADNVEGMSACSSSSSSQCDNPVPSTMFELNTPDIQVIDVCEDADNSDKHDQESSENFDEKRKRNNRACKKFRKAKKSRQQQLYLAAEQLQRENFVLESKINKLEGEIKKWKEFFENHPMYSQCKNTMQCEI